MANRVVYNWIAADSVAIAALQTYVGAATIILNGTLSSFLNGHFGPITLNGISRVVTLTSTNNLSGINVTITGMRDGAVVTETLAGPNSNTVATTTLFNVITSITTNGAVTAISVGTGQTGQTNWFLFNTMASVANLAIQCVKTGTINYTLQITLDVPNNAGTNPPATVFAPTVFTPVATLTAATTSILAAYTSPFKYANIIINSSTTNATLVSTFLQQGLKA